MLRSAGYAEIKEDYDRISRAHFDRSYFHPAEMRFAKSDALFPPTELAAVLNAQYVAQCRLLCYGPYPTWDELQAQFAELREFL